MGPSNAEDCCVNSNEGLYYDDGGQCFQCIGKCIIIYASVREVYGVVCCVLCVYATAAEGMKTFYRFLFTFSWICSFKLYMFCLLGMPLVFRRVHSKMCPWLLYLVVSSARTL